MVVPPEVIGKLLQARQGADPHTATFNQGVVYDVSRGGFLYRHIQINRAIYGERRAQMLAAMDRDFPAEVNWISPKGCESLQCV